MKVKIGNNKQVFEMTIEERMQLIDALTLLNPSYVSAVKHSPYSNVSIPKYVNYYSFAYGYLVVPRGFDIPFNYEVTEDHRLSVPVDFPPLKITPRDLQKKACDAFVARDGDGVIVLPTGTGKSICGLIIASILKQRTLIIVQKDDLIDGWQKDIKLAFGLRPKQIGLIKAQTFRVGKQFTLTTIQTLTKLCHEKLEVLRKEFGLMEQDEFHHVGAKSYDVIDSFPAKYRLGMTATDIRNDTLDPVMTFYFGTAVFRYAESDCNTDIIPPNKVTIKVKESNIIYNPPEMYTYTNSKYIYKPSKGDNIEDLIYSGKIKRKPMNYQEAKLAIMDSDRFNDMVVNDIINEYNEGKSCLVFCIEREHCRIIYRKLTKIIGEEKVQLYYGESNESKSSMKQKAESKEKMVTIATYKIATEGTNVKSWERIFLAMTFNNEKDAIQAIGRGRRTKEGKDDLVVYDYRHPNIKGIRNHGATRDRVYKKIGFNILYEHKGVKLNRGFGFLL